MRKLFFTAAALLISTLAFSQGFGGGQGMTTDPAEMAKMQAERLKEQLELTQIQYDSIYVFYLKTNKENQARREQMQQGGGQQMGQGGANQDMMEQFRKQREAQEAKLKSILTEAQFKKYQEMQAERQQRGQGGFGGGANRGQGAPR